MKALGQARGLVSLGPDPVNCYPCDLLIFLQVVSALTVGLVV